MTEVPIDTLLEATLFGAGRSMSVPELSTALGYDEDEMLDSLYSLRSTLKRRRGGALQVAEVGDRWAIEVKPDIASHLPKETKTEIPQKLLKAAALIAYHQPMPQSRLVELLGQKAYDYVRELAQLGMVDRRKDGNTRRLSTTRRFSETFGCPYTDRKKVKQWFREQVKTTGMFDGMEDAAVLKEESEIGGLIQSTLPLGEEE
ncbi:SMC-Scp complex subunit ScpB [Euryarchaeota archaeon]|nr:SMC-Scp complex subunit ScpB [Candidatus Poseidoniaceae archaeon]MDA8594494.1 SMC-Scp complex subunit ScpB [Euryarchaeota archaeon]MDA8610075.1 SMC-Scp complex subunit ScpB [Euryarchaeota archaeon]MDA8701530.1 SMC-Scp complex subunit ScpB [Euryarchaeota archaeon]MDA8843359.1 SMC-Scp complex subunit ScpB [Euryarchaeota archaeon]